MIFLVEQEMASFCCFSGKPKSAETCHNQGDWLQNICYTVL